MSPAGGVASWRALDPRGPALPTRGAEGRGEDGGGRGPGAGEGAHGWRGEEETPRVVQAWPINLECI